MPQINPQRIYLKGASLEHPAAPRAFFEQNESPVEDKLAIQLSTTPLNADVHEVAVRATLTLIREGKTLLVLELEQAGVFQLMDVPAKDVEIVLGVNCAQMVYSFLRANFSDMVSRASLPAIYLPEPNWLEQFEARSQAPAAQAPAAND